MAVNLSPIGGVAAQFFNNDGNLLSGGLIYTYLAGTTTPATTYTNGAGNIAHSNPIVLDSSGRVPTGEIWLADSLIYKFVIKDSTGALIGSYDNIVGINSNFVNYTSSQEIQTATAGQTVFTLSTMVYQPGTNSLSVFVDGVNQYGPGAQYAFTETDATTVTFNSGLHVGASVKFTTAIINNVGAVDSEQVTYDPPFTGSVVTNVEAKLAQTVSVKDFGAVGDGVTDDTAEIQAALDSGQDVYVPHGVYVSGALVISTNGQHIFGPGTIKAISTLSDGKLLSIASNVTDVVVEQITIDGNGAARSGGTKENSYELSTNDGCDRTTFRNVKVIGAYGNALGFYVSNDIKAVGNEIYGYGVNGILVLQNCINVEIANNLIDGTGTQNSIFVCGQSVNGSTNVTITGNVCYNAGDYGIEVGNVFAGNHTNVTVAGNTVSSATNTGISFRRVWTGVISGNSINDCGAALYGADGIFCTGDGGLMYGLSITGNAIKTAAAAQNGIHITNYAQVSITGNTVDGGTIACVYLEGETGRQVNDFTVANNQLVPLSVGIRTYSNSAGISYGVISGNQIEAGANATTIGVELSENTKSVTVVGNQIQNSGYSGVSVYNAQRIIVSDNVLVNCARGNGTDDQRSALLFIGTNITAAGNAVYDTGSATPMKYALRAHDSTNVQVSNLQSVGFATAATNGYSNTTSYVHTFGATITSASL